MIAFRGRARYLKEEAAKETDSSLKKYKEIELYSDGAPEQCAKKRVQELFENSSDTDYLEKYEKFAGMYPRVTSGKPWELWVSDPSTEGTETPPPLPTT